MLGVLQGGDNLFIFFQRAVRDLNSIVWDVLLCMRQTRKHAFLNFVSHTNAAMQATHSGATRLLSCPECLLDRVRVGPKETILAEKIGKTDPYRSVLI